MLRDFGYACRMLSKSPGFTAVVVLTLAFGIGADTAVFSVVDGVLLRPLPYRDSARLVDVLEASVKDPRLAKAFGTYGDFEEYRRNAHSLEKTAFATWAGGGATLTGRGPSRNILTILVSEDFFSMLGAASARGRTFERGDANHGCSVVLSDGFWRGTLAGDSAIVGAALNLNHRACTVLGVMPASFEFYPRQPALWMLLTADDPRPRGHLLVITFARLKPGVTAAQAQAELVPLHQALHKNDWQRDFTPVVDGLQDEFTFLAGRNLPITLWLLIAAVTAVLLIGCLNVANLLLTRSGARAQEYAVRAALGCSRARLIRQQLVESTVLAILGGAGGILVAWAAVQYFRHANPIELPAGSTVAINIPAIVFTAIATMSVVLICGAAPAWIHSRVGFTAGLRLAGRGGIHGPNRRLTQTLIGVEIALSLMLLAGASLLLRSVLKMSNAPLGFAPQNVIAMETQLPEQRYSTDAEKIRFYDGLERGLKATPGVESCAISTALPPSWGGTFAIQIAGKPASEKRDVLKNLVSRDYFQVLRVALLRGRLFTPEDGAGSAPVTIVNERLAQEYFPGADPIGQRIREAESREAESKDAPWLTIVGVVATEKRPELMHEMTWYAAAALYRPIQQEPNRVFSIALRTRGNEVVSSHALESAVTDLDKEIPVSDLSDMQERLSAYLKYPRFRAIVLGQFAGMALLLAAIGLYGLLSQYVLQRRREFGLRMAVGAQSRDIFRLVAREGGLPLLLGILAGGLLTAGFARFLRSLLFDVTAADPVSLAGAPVVLLIAAIVALAKPALEAASVDPAVALRDE